MNAQDHHDAEYFVERDCVRHPRRIAGLSTIILLATYLVVALVVFA